MTTKTKFKIKIRKGENKNKYGEQLQQYKLKYEVT